MSAGNGYLAVELMPSIQGASARINRLTVKALPRVKRRSRSRKMGEPDFPRGAAGTSGLPSQSNR